MDDRVLVLELRLRNDSGLNKSLLQTNTSLPMELIAQHNYVRSTIIFLKSLFEKFVYNHMQGKILEHNLLVFLYLVLERESNLKTDE